MWYLLKVDALIGALVFGAAGLVIFAMFAWHETKALVAARHEISRSLASLITEPQVFANSFAGRRQRAHRAA
jgi:hypothetical protein